MSIDSTRFYKILKVTNKLSLKYLEHFWKFSFEKFYLWKLKPKLLANIQLELRHKFLRIWNTTNYWSLYYLHTSNNLIWLGQALLWWIYFRGVKSRQNSNVYILVMVLPLKFIQFEHINNCCFCWPQFLFKIWRWVLPTN